MRYALVALAALALAGCHDDTWWNNELIVFNDGSTGVDVRVEIDGHVDFYVVWPGDAVSIFSGNAGQNVVITRISDGSLLFSAWYSDGDFEDSHGDIKVTVYP